VETGRGGSGRGGAVLTPFGKSILTRFRALERAIEKAAVAHFKKLKTDLQC
jgi:molybdate transport repressor ModE-like protein